MRVRATKIFTFDSAHFLPGYNGQCAHMHGHTYRLEVTVERINSQLVSTGPDEGMVVDFKVLKQIVKEKVVDLFDHQVLNRLVSFRTTAENLAIFIFETVNLSLRGMGVRCVKVKLYETPTSFVEVTENESC